MTWLGDKLDLPEAQRTALLSKRESLVLEITALNATPLPRSVAGKQGRQEDLLALAKKVTAIDKKLGRL
jgi:hypothetical protein